MSECKRQDKASARAWRARGCRSAGRDGGARVRARGATAARVSERGARRRREGQSAGRDGGASVRARGAGASDRVQAPVQVSECKRQNRASDRAWQVRGCRSASARIKQVPGHGECAGVGARGATAAQVSERGARRRCECRSAGRDGGASDRARGATAARVPERGARRQGVCQSAGRDGGAKIF